MEKALMEIGYSKLEHPDKVRIKVRENLMIVRIDDDIAVVFKNEAAVNEALRTLIRLLQSIEGKKEAA